MNATGSIACDAAVAAALLASGGRRVSVAGGSEALPGASLVVTGPLAAVAQSGPVPASSQLAPVVVTATRTEVDASLSSPASSESRAGAYSAPRT